MSNRVTGRVKWFKSDKGFGFIRRDDGKNDVFVHHTGISGDGYRKLDENDAVAFDVEMTEKGEKAVNVSKI